MSSTRKIFKKFGLNFNRKVINAVDQLHQNLDAEESKDLVVSAALNDLNSRVKKIEEQLSKNN